MFLPIKRDIAPLSPSGFTEYLGIDLGSLEPRQLRGEGTFAHPCPPPCLPDDDRWPPRQSGLTLYIRPKVLSGTRLAPSEEVDDFLNSIALAQSSSKVEPSHETVERVKNESNSEDQRALLNIEGIVVKSEESELPIDPHFSGDTTDPPPPEPVDPLSGFDEETRSVYSFISPPKLIYSRKLCSSTQTRQDVCNIAGYRRHQLS